jgi:phage replication-related protein YjqB (UPF0714/DUF867 family)
MPSCARFLASAALIALTLPLRAADKYPNFAALAAAERDGVDYRITAVDRRSGVAVLAIHAGGIEPGCGELARAIAGGDWSLYLFESLKSRDNMALHITSTNFDEPRALALVARSSLCISVHGAAGVTDGICIGGGNAELRRAVRDGIARADLGIPLEEPCSRFPALERSNITNRCERQGVQLELTRSLRDRLRADPALEAKLGAAIRDGVQAYEKKP